MFHSVLLAVDGSENAIRAAESAVGLVAALPEASLAVVYVAAPPAQSRVVKANFDVHALLEEDARTVAGPVLSLIEGAGVPYTLEVGMGDPTSEILAAAGKVGADLIVIGSRGLGALQGVVMGSVSQKTAQLAACPVMIVK
ncbi:universal stress protein [Methanofollis formosanus]|uniref:Universal stress protein n=1 Tax=Methanofollis formosanus TaxID=299308 RepID=A0A8G1A491_9EURY|nr:universal stress protein [Methanofollis formosanus]QYZ80148.1 universal stress protein [Methanofollis formosanus]